MSFVVKSGFAKKNEPNRKKKHSLRGNEDLEYEIGPSSRQTTPLGHEDADRCLGGSTE